MILFRLPRSLGWHSGWDPRAPSGGGPVLLLVFPPPENVAFGLLCPGRSSFPNHAYFRMIGDAGPRAAGVCDSGFDLDATQVGKFGSCGLFGSLGSSPGETILN